MRCAFVERRSTGTSHEHHVGMFFFFSWAHSWDSCKYVVSCFFDCLHGLHVLQVHGLHDGFIIKTPS